MTDVVYNQFSDAVEGKAELVIKPKQTLRFMKVMGAVFESAESGNAVKVNVKDLRKTRTLCSAIIKLNILKAKNKPFIHIG